MNIYKQIKYILAIAIISFAFASCNESGRSIKEIKLIPVKIGKVFQYIDTDGKIIINPQFSEATVFRNGLALVQTASNNPQWAFINEDGKFVSTANYKDATVFSENMAWVVNENAAPSCINTKGELKFTLTNAEEVKIFSDGLASFSEINGEGEEIWGFVDPEGKIKINPQFSDVGNFVDGKCPVSGIDGKWGYIDKSGKLIINYQFDNAESFINASAVVKSGGKTGLIDINGKYLINPQFSKMQSDGNMFLIFQDGKYGWTDKEGKIIINPQFSKALPFSNANLAAVQSGNEYGYIDKEGKMIINPQFEMALPFNGKLALVISSNKIGFIDKAGKYIINPQFDNVSSDLVEFVKTGDSPYNSVRTDYFNIGIITSRINCESPEGLSFNSTISEILAKFDKSEEDLVKYSSEHLMISSEKITSYSSLDFYFLGNPWISGGFYSYDFSGEIKPAGYAYMINLTGKAVGKENIVKMAIENSLTGYTKNESIAQDLGSEYRNAKQKVAIYIKNSSIIVAINPLID